jgi:hypothetical protein
MFNRLGLFAFWNHFADLISLSRHRYFLQEVFLVTSPSSCYLLKNNIDKLLKNELHWTFPRIRLEYLRTRRARVSLDRSGEVNGGLSKKLIVGGVNLGSPVYSLYTWQCAEDVFWNTSTSWTWFTGHEG